MTKNKKAKPKSSAPIVQELTFQEQLALAAKANNIEIEIPKEEEPAELPPQNEDTGSFTKAPYNFVPFSDHVITRYAAVEELPRHDRIDSTLLSGEIRLSLRAETPLIVGGAQGSCFSQDSEGNYIVAGSSLRGMIRQNMQILGFGAVRPGQDYDDIRMLYRDLMGTTQIGGSAKKQASDRAGAYKKAMDTQTFKVGEKTVSKAKNAHPGYLYCIDAYTYEIHPAMNYIRISRDNPIVKKWQHTYTRRETVWYQIDQYSTPSSLVLREKNPGGDFHQGVLLLPGYVSRQNSVYLFLEENSAARSVKLTEEEVNSYKADYYMKKNGLKGTDPNHIMNPEFWELPKPGEKRAVFYVTDDHFTSFGVTQFLRVGYLKKLSDGAPRVNPGQLLDYPNAIMGFAGKENSYRSRVRVNNLKSVSQITPMEPVSPILAEPKPSFYSAYLMPNGDKAVDYNYSDMKLRGFKQYWFKNFSLPKSVSGNMVSSFQALPAGTVFTGSIRFTNLHEDELGLLLWCLRLDKRKNMNYYQSLGKAKPFGYGRVSITIDSVALDNQQDCFRSFEAAPAAPEDTDKAVDAWIKAYYTYAQDALAQLTGHWDKLANFPRIKDFMYLHSKIFGDPSTASYMDVNKTRNVLPPLPTVAALREIEAANRKAAR